MNGETSNDKRQVSYNRGQPDCLFTIAHCLLPILLIQRVPSVFPDIVFYIHPESDKHIYNNGRAHGEQGNVDKMLADDGTCDPHFFTYVGANAKHLPFDKVLEPVHNAKLKKINNVNVKRLL